MKRWFIPAAARARGQSNDLNREILASNLFDCHKEVINAPPVPSIARCIHIVYRHKNVWEYQWSNFIYNCMSTFLHFVRCKDALLDCSAPGGERCESLTWVDEIELKKKKWPSCLWVRNSCYFHGDAHICQKFLYSTWKTITLWNFANLPTDLHHHDSCRWPGARYAPGHQQPPCWFGCDYFVKWTQHACHIIAINALWPSDTIWQ